MPKTSGPTQFHFGKILGDLRRDLNAVITQQNQSTVDATLTTRLFSGLQGDGTYGITAYDAAGNKRATFGGLPDGNHGIAIYDEDNDGGYVEVNAPLVAEIPFSTVLATTSTTDAPISGSPALPIAVGASGKCLVTLSSYLSIPAGGQAVAGLFVDGVVSSSPGLPIDLTSTSAMSVTASNSALLTGLSQGAHTLSVEYRSTTGASVSFAGVAIIAIPY
jgi:hypothetical protein